MRLVRLQATVFARHHVPDAARPDRIAAMLQNGSGEYRDGMQPSGMLLSCSIANVRPSPELRAPPVLASSASKWKCKPPPLCASSAVAGLERGVSSSRWTVDSRIRHHVGRKVRLRMRCGLSKHGISGPSDFHRDSGQGWPGRRGDVTDSSLVVSESNDGRPSCRHGLQTSITKAFSSMVLMLKALQSYALQMRSHLFYEDVDTVAHVIHREMQASFLWLFQQVFSCTPVLMVSVMLLFSDFTAFSASANFVPIEISEPKEIRQPTFFIEDTLAEVGSMPSAYQHAVEVEGGPLSYASFSGGFGGRGKWTVPTVPGFDDESMSSRLRSNSLWDLAGVSKGVAEPLPSDPPQADHALARLMESTVKEMEIQDGKPVAHIRLDQEVVRQLVAPVSIDLEEDDYVCFDRTELQYRSAIEEDEHNPMLLSNYAQFLYIVRRDFDRSESYFHKALREDPTDGDILGRFATFLWLARRDKEAAERAYKAALASNPDNPYYSGSYAHFLWHSGEDEAGCPLV